MTNCLIERCVSKNPLQRTRQNIRRNSGDRASSVVSKPSLVITIPPEVCLALLISWLEKTFRVASFYQGIGRNSASIHPFDTLTCSRERMFRDTSSYKIFGYNLAAISPFDTLTSSWERSF